jgi:hypothetical protein
LAAVAVRGVGYYMNQFIKLEVADEILGSRVAIFPAPVATDGEFL